MVTPNAKVRGLGGRFVKKQEEPTPELKEKSVPETEKIKESEEKKEMAPSIEMEQKEEPTPELKAEPVPETEAVKESMSREEVPGIPKPSSTITKGTSIAAETKAAKGKEEEKEPPAASYTTYRVRGSGRRFEKQKEEPTPVEEEIRKEISVRDKKTTKRGRKILLSPMSQLGNTAKGISDNLLSGIWLTGVTIGLLKKSVDEIKKFIEGIERKVSLYISEDAKNIEGDLKKSLNNQLTR